MSVHLERMVGGVPRKSAQCSRCGIPLPSQQSYLVHFRDCRPSSGIGTCPIPRPLKRRRLFVSDARGLGAGGAPRREDYGLVVAAHEDDDGAEAKASSQEALQAEAPERDTLEPGAEWTSEATTEEVIEAIRRLLLDIGAATGAKTVNLMIKLLKHPRFCVHAFNKGIASHDGIRADANRQLEDDLLSLRFEKDNVVDTEEGDADANMWIRDPVEVVRRQIATMATDKCDMNRLIMECDSVRQCGDDGKRLYSHPMSTPLAATVAERVRDAAMTACARGDKDVSGWEDGYDFVLLLQVYSDKSSQTLKTSSHTHFPLHVAVMNTSLGMKEKLIVGGDCVVGYLPTDISWQDEEAKIWENELEDAVAGRGSRSSRLRILQKGIEKCLKPLLSRTVSGFRVRDSSGKPLRCHPVLWSYVTDLPEGWDISSAVHNRCSRCEVKKGDLCSTKACTTKEAEFIIMDYDELDRRRSKPKARGATLKMKQEEMWGRSLGPVRPYLLSLGDNFGVDLFRCLRYEVMHNVHLGLTKTLLTCMSERLKSTSLYSTEFLYASPPYNLKKFSTVRTTILRSLNQSMDLMDRQSPLIDFKVSFRSKKRTVTLNGLFQEDGLASMLEANDYARVLQVMPFLAATCDRMCGERGTTTRLFVEYVELAYFLTRDKQHCVAVSDRDLRELRRRVRKFMISAHKHFAEYQKSDMAFPKMHALVHATQDMADGGLLAHYRANAYETGHKVIKGAFEGGSRRGESGHEEALGTIERADFVRLTSGTTRCGARIDVVARLSRPPPRKRNAMTSTKEDAMDLDSVAMTRAYVSFSASKALDFVAFYRGQGCLAFAQKWPKWVPVPIRELVTDLGGPRAFEWFMNKLDVGRDDLLHRSNSVYASGFPCPVLAKDCQGKNMLITVDEPGSGDAIDKQVRREIQRVVAAHRFSGSKHPVQNFVMVEAAGPEETKKKLCPSVLSDLNSSSTVRAVHIAKVLAFVTHRRISPARPGNVAGTASARELALVQYMEIAPGQLDDVDKALGCPKLRWAQEDHRRDVEKNVDRMRCWYGVEDVATIRGLVHVVRGDYGLGSTKTYKCEGDRHWSKSWFYVNRFKLGRRGAGVFTEEQE